MNCTFCNKNLIQGSFTEWMYCQGCKASFDIFGTIIGRIHMQCTIDGRCYQLEQDYVLKTARIVILPDTVDGTVIMVMDFDYLLKNVTPTNLEYKIKTSVLFS